MEPQSPKIFFGSAESQGKRTYMEDRNCIIPDYRPLGTPDDSAIASTTFSGVFDGHLSSKAAAMAANNLHTILSKEPGFLGSLKCKQPADQEELSLALRRSFQRCDHQILAASRAEENWKGGTTACIALTIGKDLFVAHVGDSGALVVRGGTARRLTLDHKPTNPPEKRRIVEAGGQVNETLDRVYSAEKGTLLAMSRALGDRDFKEGGDALVSNRPDVRHLNLEPQDSAIIIATDGLFDVLSDQEAADIVSKFLNADEDWIVSANHAASGLVTASLAAGTTDNITAVVALLQWS